MAVETPRYATVLRDGDHELRDYPALVVAEVTVEGDDESTTAQGNRRPLSRTIPPGNARGVHYQRAQLSRDSFHQRAQTRPGLRRILGPMQLVLRRPKL